MLIILLRYLSANKLTQEQNEIFIEYFKPLFSRSQFKILINLAKRKTENNGEILIERGNKFEDLYFLCGTVNFKSEQVPGEQNLKTLQKGSFLCMFECHNFLLNKRMEKKINPNFSPAPRSETYIENQSSTFNIRLSLNAGERKNKTFVYYKWSKEALTHLNRIEEGKEIFNALYSMWLSQTIQFPSGKSGISQSSKEISID